MLIGLFAHSLFRLEFLHQYFHLWSNYAEKHRQLLLPIKEDTEICPVDITDVCKVIEILLIDSKSQQYKDLSDQHDGQVYTLTGPETVHGKRLVEFLISATGYSHFKFHQGRPMDLNYYLSGLSKDVWFDARLKREMSQMYHDKFQEKTYTEKAYDIPTGKCGFLR